jgi:CubicO group peptidase (beta-lactamase class C family)
MIDSLSRRRRAAWVSLSAPLSLSLSLSVLLSAAVAARAETPAPGLVPAAEVGLDAAKLAEIPKRTGEFVEKKQAAGVVTLVARKGKIVAIDCVGQADIEAGRAMAPDTLFWIASMTKPIASTAFMTLVDEGKVSVDDPVGKYVPEFNDIKHKDGKPPAKPITIRQLLTHTSGVDMPKLEPGAKPTMAEFAVGVAKAPLKFEPGSKWEYGGLTNITVVGRIAEIVSGKPFDVFLSERVLTPLGMKDTGFAPTEAHRARLCKIYQPNKDKTGLEPTKVVWINAEADKDKFPNPSGGLYSSARDLAAFYHMVLAGGVTPDGKRLLSEKAVHEMTTGHTGDLKAGFVGSAWWGLGWSVVKDPAASPVTSMLSVGTYGHGGAFGTQGWVDPKKGLVLILLVNRSNFGNSDASDLRRAFQEAAVAALKE